MSTRPSTFTSWPGLTRPSAPERSGHAGGGTAPARPDRCRVDGRVKPGHDGRDGRDGWDGWGGRDGRCGKLRQLLAALLLLLSLAAPAFAVEPSERLANPALEARARAISATLRCLVCQNESIDESSADLAHDIRILLRQRIAAGDTDAQAVQAIVSRYGQFVLLKPPVEPATYVLWFGPVGLLVLGFIGTFIWLNRRPATASAAAPLNAAEQRRLESLLQENEQ